MDKGELGVMIPILVPLGFFALVFGIIYLRNRERMAMIERGMDPRLNKGQPAPYQYLKWGLLLIGSGLGLFLANILDHYVLSSANEDNPAVYFALIALFGGLGLFVSYRIEKKELWENDNKPE